MKLWRCAVSCPPQALADGGVALAPFAGLKGAQRLFGGLGIDGAVNALKAICSSVNRPLFTACSFKITVTLPENSH